MALLGGGLRTATVKASGDEPVSVVAMDEKAFNSLTKDSPRLREELIDLLEKRNIYNQMQLISSLNQKVLASILKENKPVTYEAGHEILKQGDVGNSFYLLLDGKVDILIKDEHGGEELVSHLTKGNYFGEMALMGDTRRQATVRVSKGRTAKVLELGVQEFEQLTSSSQEFKTHIRKVAGARKKEIETTRMRKAQK
jgi:cAMP-dependent protein kinase regulator